jgi:hypothetical protein
LDSREGRLALRAGSLLIAPPHAANNGWPAWRAAEHVHPTPSEQALDAPGSFVVDVGLVTVARVTLPQSAARRWLSSILSRGEAPMLDDVPPLTGLLGSASAPIRIPTESETAAGVLACQLGRPISGYHFPLVGELDPVAPGDPWEIAGVTHYGAARELLGMAWYESVDGVPSGLLVGRFERRAWLAGMHLHAEHELYEVKIGYEADRVDVADLEIEVEERVGGELVISERLRLEDLDLKDADEIARQVAQGDVRRPILGVRLPSLGRGVQRSVRLHTREGELLDDWHRFNVVERIGSTLTVDGHQMPTTWIGESRGPANLVERLAGVERMRSQYATLRRDGISSRLFDDFAAARASLRLRLERATGELLVVDPWLRDWELLTDLPGGPPRVLIGARVPPPPQDFGGRVARWHGPREAPFHDRFFLWEGGGISVGTSAGPTNRMFRISRIASPEAEELRERFALWWIDPQFRVV